MGYYLVVFFSAALWMSGCASTQSAVRLREIQEREGLWTRSLWYLGSSLEYHYFEQVREGLLPYRTSMKRFKVPVDELVFPDALVFCYDSSNHRPEGIWSSNVEGVATKVRITERPPHAVEGREPRPDRLRRQLREEDKALRDYIRQVSARIEALYAESNPLATLATNYYVRHGRWPTDPNELWRDIDIVGADGHVWDWLLEEDVIFSTLPDGKFSMRYMNRKLEISIIVEKPEKTTVRQESTECINE